MSENRTIAERIAETRQRLNNDENVWIATASLGGVPHLVPLSLAWDGEAILVATRTNTPTVRNALASGRVRATLDSAADVVLPDTDAAALRSPRLASIRQWRTLHELVGTPATKTVSGRYSDSRQAVCRPGTASVKLTVAPSCATARGSAERNQHADRYRVVAASPTRRRQASTRELVAG